MIPDGDVALAADGDVAVMADKHDAVIADGEVGGQMAGRHPLSVILLSTPGGGKRAPTG